jgi:hypothetical protein
VSIAYSRSIISAITCLERTREGSKGAEKKVIDKVRFNAGRAGATVGSGAPIFIMPSFEFHRCVENN